jgi:flagellar motor protein MotB
MKTLLTPILLLLLMVRIAAALDVRQEPCVFRTMVTQEVSHETFVVTGNADSFANLSCRVAVVFFPVGKFTLSDAMAKEILDSLKKNQVGSSDLLEVIGHTCSLGSESLNQELSQHRAEVVATFLRENGFSVQSIRGLADKQPIASNYPDNRRVEINLLRKTNHEEEK